TPSPASPTTRSQRSTTCCHGAGTDSGQTGRLPKDEFPRAFKLTGKAVGWSADSITKWIQNRERA
ncbi:helix-turn-helix transcriptional regulator, partial [Gemmobacter serpentinus]|uniref:helix-turn-helix transcriptional regulator n=1 Tax=Gemmobacter serpentinus TaxID=2652247 RepID=UPI00124E500F